MKEKSEKEPNESERLNDRVKKVKCPVCDACELPAPATTTASRNRKKRNGYRPQDHSCYLIFFFPSSFYRSFFLVSILSPFLVGEERRHHPAMSAFLLDRDFYSCVLFYSRGERRRDYGLFVRGYSSASAVDGPVEVAFLLLAFTVWHRRLLRPKG